MMLKWLAGIVFVALIFVSGRAVGVLLKQRATLPVEAWWLAWLPLLIWTSILLHEGGHLLGGRLASFHPRLLIAGPLRVEFRAGRGRFSWERSLALWGGLSACLPDALDLQNLQRRLLLMVAGGPAASLLASALGWGLVVFTHHPLLRFLGGCTGLLNAVLALVTLMPISAGGFRSDGQRLLQLLRGGPSARRLTALHFLLALSEQTRPRDWPADMMSDCFTDPSYDGVSSAWLCHLWHLDREEWTAAERSLEEALQLAPQWPATARPLLYAGAAYFLATHTAQTARAQSYLDRCTAARGLLTPEALVLAEAAVARALGDHDRAGELLHQTRKAAALLPEATAAQINELVNWIERRS